MTGPESIEPNQAPGGLVAHIYKRSGALVMVLTLTGPPDPTMARQLTEQLTREGDEVVLVVFDGDTGRRVMVSL